jgi:3-oxoacyl-[acyl-carrier-protein] synthase II
MPAPAAARPAAAAATRSTRRPRPAARRVVVTGVGAVSALGPDVPSLWRGCLTKRTVVELVPAEWRRYSDLRSQVWSPLGESARPQSALLGRVEAKRLDPSSQMAIAAAEEALRSAALPLTVVDEKRRTFRVGDWRGDRLGVFMGTGAAGLHSMLGNGAQVALSPARKRLAEVIERLSATTATRGEGAARARAALATELATVLEDLRAPALFNPFAVAATMGNALSANLSIKLGAHGPTPTFAGACAGGTMAIGRAFRAIRDGECDAALAGGSDYLRDPWGATFRAFDAVGALAHGDFAKERINRPFDEKRNGFLFSEGGCGVLVLEELGAALARGAPRLAELRGYGEASDAHDLMAVDPSGAQVRRAIAACLADAGLDAKDVGYVNAHGTGTPGNDGVEAEAIAAVVGRHALVSSTKSMLGHTLGASGALEAVVTALTLRDQVIHPSINLEQPVADLAFATGATRALVEHAISQSFAFGGHDAVIAMSRVD